MTSTGPTRYSYKDSYIIIIDGKRYIRHDVIFELYQNQPNILKVDPTDRNPTDPKQDSNYTNKEYLEEFDHQLSQPVRDPLSIFSKSALQSKQAESNSSKLTSSQTENSSTVPMSEPQNASTVPMSEPPHRSKRNLRPTEKYVNYRSDILNQRSHQSISQLNADITKLVSDTDNQLTNPADNSPKCLLVPQTLREALSGLYACHWYAAWQKEMSKVTDRKTWESTTTEKVEAMIAKALKSKFTFRLQCLADGTWKYKVRLVACGYSQIAGHDYHETFAPTAKFKSICIVLNLAAIHDWEIHGLDIENAFLESDLDETIYMRLPVDTYSEANGKPVIVKLKKSLYGLKQAGELFYKLMKRILTSDTIGMKCCMHDMCVFTLFDDETNERVIVLLWVDDIIVTGNSTSIVTRIISHVESSVT